MNLIKIGKYAILAIIVGIAVPLLYDVYSTFTSPTINEIKIQCAKNHLAQLWKVYDAKSNTFSGDYSQKINNDFLADTSLLVNNDSDSSSNILAIYSWETISRNKKKHHFVFLLKSGEILSR